VCVFFLINSLYGFIVVNNKDYFKKNLYGVYIVNFNMGLATLTDIRLLCLTIMQDLIKYRYGERVRSKILGFDNQPNSRQTWV
jgi:hypothetical protein